MRGGQKTVLATPGNQAGGGYPQRRAAVREHTPLSGLGEHGAPPHLVHPPVLVIGSGSPRRQLRTCTPERGYATVICHGRPASSHRLL
jgi:hypothetical protein